MGSFLEPNYNIRTEKPQNHYAFSKAFIYHFKSISTSSTMKTTQKQMKNISLWRLAFCAGRWASNL